MSKRKKSPNKAVSSIRPDKKISSALNLRLPAGMAIIILLAFIAYFPSINGGFIMDDDGLLTNNDIIRTPSGLYRFWCTTEAIDYWPATNSTFWIEWRLWGMNATGYHFTNLILHIVEALLIWIILRKLAIPGAFLAALIFAVHPVNVESVAWIAQRKNLMAMLFFLLSILWYLKADMPTTSNGGLREREKTFSSFILHPSSFHFWYWLSLLAFLIAMLSKGSVAVLPALLLGIIWWLRILTWRDLVRTAPFFIVAAILTSVNVWFQTHGSGEVLRNAGFAARILGAGSMIWFYLYKAIFPVDLSFIYPLWDIPVNQFLCWLPLFAALAVTGILWAYRKSLSRPFLFAWGFFCVALLPTMGFTDVYFMKYSLVADRYQHIAIIGIIALASAGFTAWFQGAKGETRWAAAIVLIMAIGSCSFLTRRQCGMYRDAITLYETTLKKNPHCSIVENNLGKALFDIGRLPEAMDHYRKAISLNPGYVEANYNLGNALVQTGRSQEAIEYFRQSIKLAPQLPMAHNNLAVALLNTGNPREAIGHCQEALRIMPNNIEAYNNLGNAYKAIGQYPQAIEQYEKALQLDSNHNDTYINLGATLVESGQPGKAIVCCNRALQLQPNCATTYFVLALAYASMRQPSQAFAASQKASRLARSQGQTDLVKQIDNWLKSYSANLSTSPNTPPPEKTAPTKQ
ncbi:MAG: tetratricopeptide repeat protein [Thermoguttaceae bacterium]|jgi:tetratricopeptide (TPR) repeat protein